MQGALREELSAELKPDFTQNVMRAVRQTEQAPPGLVDRLVAFLSRPIAVPLAAAAAVAIMWAIGLPEATTIPQLSAPGINAGTAPKTVPVATGETEIESIDNQTDYNVLVLAAPGSPNRMIWLSERTSDEG